MGGRRWTEAEDEKIREAYPRYGVHMLARLPGRTQQGLIVRARALGVEGPRSTTPGRKSKINRSINYG